MKKIFTLLIFSLFYCISQEQISFAETTNIFIKEQTENSVENQTKTFASRVMPSITVYSPYRLFVGNPFDEKQPIRSFTDETGNKASYDKLEISWLNDEPIDTNKVGSTASIIYTYHYGDGNSVSAKVDVSVESDKTRAELKDVNLYVDQKWDIFSVMKDVTDKYGTPIKNWEKEYLIDKYFIDGKETKKLDTSKPGKHTIQIAIQNAYRELVYSNEVTVTVEDGTKAELKDAELYVGQEWNLTSVFKNVLNKQGKPILPEQVESVYIDGEKTKELDTSKPGKHEVSIAILDANNTWISSNKVIVTVKEDKTSIKTKDSVLYVGQKWEPKSNFVSATDEDGYPVPWEDPRIIKNESNIDTSKPAEYKIEYTFQGKVKNINSSFTVTVKEDKASIKTKDSMLYVGQKWEPKSNFVSATDEDGYPVPWEDPRIIKNESNIDTSKPAEYKIEYTFQGKVKNVSSSFTVTVKEEPFIINQVPYFDFEDYILEPSNKSVSNKKNNPTIELETPSIIGKDWQLQVELSPFLDKANDKSILKGVSLFIPKGKLESDLEADEPIQYDCHLEANGEASILMYGTKTKGKGRWKNKLKAQEITLSIPSENKKGNYESTLHWTLLDVPS
ncbi:bacterial Ig-like domain-containing protein [Enterococcus faecalis]|uniref:bacterial Ig-like domain-containing protein n=1 Tax=Enterococcus faecalis TaxID=1351 RepID=UPI0025B0D4F5|nr:bacterial Ig-like domain-containing protein [Enterococcus faecalis]MDN3190649.1 bacterial Ig-like domain-containing protein [Enterococcus faecalis]